MEAEGVFETDDCPAAAATVGLTPLMMETLGNMDQSINFSGGQVESSKLVGQDGNDTFNFGSSATNTGSTFYFGNGDGDDKLYFAKSFTSAASNGLTIAVDSALGATSAFRAGRDE